MRERIIDVGGVVMGKRKGFKGKEKLIGTIAGVTAIAAPLMMVPGQSGYAQETVPAEVNYLKTIVVPLHGSKYIDLAELYHAGDFSVQLQEETDEAFASVEPTFGHDGIYKINANEIGTTTFTLFAMKYEVGPITDTFQVVVVPTIEDPSEEYKFDISRMTSDMIQTKEQAVGLLSNIHPLSLINFDSIDYNSSNTPPFQTEPIEMIVQGRLGEPIYSTTLENQILDYFSDYNLEYNYECECQNPTLVPEQLYVIFNDENNSFMNVSQYESGSMLKFTPTAIGSFYMDVTVTDHHGGFTNAVIPFEIKAPIPAPLINEDSVIANHFEQEGSMPPIMYLSNDAEIDMDEIFYNEDDLTYTLEVEYGYQTPNIEELTLDNAATSITWNSLNLLLNEEVEAEVQMNRINRITATRSTKHTDLNVNIQHSTNDPFPASIDMYQSNAAGTSSYMLNYKSVKGFNGAKISIANSDIQNKAPNSVTAQVYEEDPNYLKFDFGNGTNSNKSTVKVYAHNSDNNILYLDDFNFNLVSPAQTPLPSSNIQTIQFHRLYPEVNSSFWSQYAQNLDDLITSENINDVFLEYWYYENTQIGSVTAIFPYDINKPSGTTKAVLRIDPFDGSKVFIVPFIKP